MSFSKITRILTVIMKKQYLNKLKKHFQQKVSPYLKDKKSFNNKNNNDDDDHDDDDGNGDVPRLPTPPSFPPKNNEFDSEFDSDDKKLTPQKNFF